MLWGGTPKTGKLNFSTNGIYWMGKAGIPTITCSQGDETTAHGVLDQVPLADLVQATEFYALLPALLIPRVEWLSRCSLRDNLPM